MGSDPTFFVSLLTQGGVTGLLGLWLWSERKERIRLQRIVEGYLTVAETSTRLTRALNRVVTGADDGAA